MIGAGAPRRGQGEGPFQGGCRFWECCGKIPGLTPRRGTWRRVCVPDPLVLSTYLGAAARRSTAICVSGCFRVSKSLRASESVSALVCRLLCLCWCSCVYLTTCLCLLALHACLLGACWLVACLSACLPACLSVCLSIWLSGRPSVVVCLYVCLCLSVFAYLCLSLSVSVCVCVSVCSCACEPSFPHSCIRNPLLIQPLSVV